MYLFVPFRVPSPSLPNLPPSLPPSLFPFPPFPLPLSPSPTLEIPPRLSSMSVQPPTANHVNLHPPNGQCMWRATCVIIYVYVYIDFLLGLTCSFTPQLRLNKLYTFCHICVIFSLSHTCVYIYVHKCMYAYLIGTPPFWSMVTVSSLLHPHCSFCSLTLTSLALTSCVFFFTAPLPTTAPPIPPPRNIPNPHYPGSGRRHSEQTPGNVTPVSHHGTVCAYMYIQYMYTVPTRVCVCVCSHMHVCVCTTIGIAASSSYVIFSWSGRHV